MINPSIGANNLNVGIAERQETTGDRVRILVVTANPLGSTPLQLDREVKMITEALRRSRKRDNFVVEYRLAATPSDLRRALLDLEPHILHFSGHGAGDQGLLFVSNESAGNLYRSDSGEVRAQTHKANEIRFVPAEPLAELLGLCDDHLECVVLNACYSDVQGNAIATYIPITIGTRDQINDRVAMKFAEGFYDAVGAGKSYEKAFEWGKVAIKFDLANSEATKILVLRKKGETTANITPTPPNPEPSKTIASAPETLPSLSASYYFDSALEKQNKGDNQGAIVDYDKAIELNPNYSLAYNNRGLAKSGLKDYEGAIVDYNKAIELNPNYAHAYNNRGNAKYDLKDYEGAIVDDNKAIELNPNYDNAYYTRGLAYQRLNERQRALADFREAARLYQQQGNTTWYQKANDRIRELEG